VDVVRHDLKAVWEARAVGDEGAVRVAARLHDAVVQVEILVAGRDEAAGHHRVDRRAHHRLRWAHFKVVP
jgi:hypothetical protein